MARTLHIEELTEKLNDYTSKIRRAVYHGRSTNQIRADIERAQEELQEFLEDGHGIYLDWTVR